MHHHVRSFICGPDEIIVYQENGFNGKTYFTVKRNESTLQISKDKKSAVAFAEGYLHGIYKHELHDPVGRQLEIGV